jgi:hypothetical protein
MYGVWAGGAIDDFLESESCREPCAIASLFCVCEFSLIPNGCNSLTLELAA